MPSSSIRVNSVNRDPSFFVVEDTSDYTGVNVLSTDLVITSPSGDEYNIDVFNENFQSTGETYNITTSLLSYPTSKFEDGVYSFVFKATLDDSSVLISPTYYLLMDLNIKDCWAKKFEVDMDKNDALTEKSKRLRSEIRLLIEGANYNFNEFKYIAASDILSIANELCNNKCNC